MNKNLVIGIIIIILIVALSLGSYLLLNSKDNKVNENTINNNNDKYDNNNTNATDKSILVVYYSAQGHTEDVAKKIANNLNADIFQIEPKEEYTSSDLDWTNNNSRVSKEHDNESLRNIELKTTEVNNFDKYDTILIGYPIWWGIAAWPVNTFVKANNFTGKTVIPFCTSSSSGLGNSGQLLKDIANSGNWIEGIRFNSNPSDSDIKTFTDSILK